MPSRAKTASKAARTRPSNAPKRRSAAATSERTALARVTRERDEALEQQAATAEILKVISQSAFDLSAVLQALVSSAARLCEADTGIVRGREGDIYPVAATVGFSENERDYFARYSVKPDRGSVFGRAILERRSIHVPDLLADHDLNRDRRKDYSKVVNIRTGLGVLLLREGKIIGVFTLQRRKQRPFTKKQIALAETFANQAVIAIENTRLFDEVQARTGDLSEALEQQTATSEVLEAISSSPGELTPVFSKMLENATRVCEATFGILNLWDGVHFRTAAGHNVPPAFAAVRRDKPIEPHPQSLLFKVLETHRLVHVHDAKTASGYLAGAPNAVEMVEVAGARTVLIVPMLKEAELIGTFTIFRQEVRPFTDRQIALLENFTKQAVIAIENTRLINETKEALAHQTATSDVLQVLGRSMTDAQPVFERILDITRSLVGIEELGILLAAGDGCLHMAAHRGTAVEAFKGVFPMPIEETAANVVMVEQRQRYFADALNDPDAPPGMARSAEVMGNYSTVMTPMVWEGRSIGVIAVAREPNAVFSEKELRLLQTFADQAVIAIQNVRLFNETKEALARQTATADVLKVIASSPSNLQPVFDAIAERSNELMHGHSTTVFRFIGNMVELAAFTPVSDEADAVLRAAFPRPHSMLPGLDLAFRGEVQETIDAQSATEPQSSRDIARARGFRGRLAMPLRSDSGIIGAISITRKESGAFADKDKELLRTFADQAVIAIQNVELFEQVQARTRDLEESLQQQTATADVLQMISSSPGDLAPVFDRMLENAVRVCGAEFGVMNLVESGSMRHVALCNVPSEFAAVRLNKVFVPHPKSPLATAVATKEIVHLADMRDTASYRERAPATVELIELGGARTIVTVPMLRDDNVIGAMTIYRNEVRPFDDRQIELLSNFAKQAVIAIENARLLRELRQLTDDLSEALVFQTGSSNILKVIASSPTDVDPALKAIVESACEICEAYDALVFLKDGGDLVFSAHHGPIPINLERWPINRRWVTGRAVVDKTPQHIHDLLGPEGDDFPEGRELARNQGQRTVLSVPLLQEGEAVGVISLRRIEVQPFDDKQIELLKSFADQAVIAISNVRLFEQVQERTRELSRSLNDLRTAQDRLIQTEKLASLGQLTAGIAHEIKNPLNFVNNFSALSAELTDELNDILGTAAFGERTRKEVDELTRMLKDNLEKVVQHGKRADSIVKNMLLHSREGSGEYRPADINLLLEESLNLAYHGARAEKPGFSITLQRDFDAAAGSVELFPQEITRAFLNLISNSFYAATRRKSENAGPGFEPTLTAATKNLGSAVEIRIRDNGTGIPAEVREKMFNPFFTTKPAGEGTGLGLSMTHDIIVKQHGGRIDVDTEPGSFTEFIITLPRTVVPQNTAGSSN